MGQVRIGIDELIEDGIYKIDVVSLFYATE